MKVVIQKLAVPSELIREDIQSYAFEILMSNKYPFRDPQVLCHTQFTHPMVCITDKRDLFQEVVGEGGWRVGHKLYSLIQLIPEFIQEMYLMEEDLQAVGKFHLGQVYDLTKFGGDASQRSMNVFDCHEEIDGEEI